MNNIKSQNPSMEGCEKTKFVSRINENQSAFFPEYRAALKVDGFFVEDALECAVEAGMPECIIEELKEFFGMLNSEIQFLIADGLVTYFARGEREYGGIPCLDASLDRLFDKMDNYLTPYAIKREADENESPNANANHNLNINITLN